jgi:hypothetical protein
MRYQKAFLSCAAVAAAGLLAGPVAHAAGPSGTNVQTPAPDPPPLSCSTGLFTLRVSSGPSSVGCSAVGGCTQIEYEVVSGGTPDHVAVLEGIGVWFVDGPGNQWYPPCAGDPVTDLGERSCHEQAAKVNPTDAVKKFKVGLAGQRKPSPTSIATKKGNKVGSCRILGIGLESGPNPSEPQPMTETIESGDGCSVVFTFSGGGDLLSARLTQASIDAGCESPNLGEDGSIELQDVNDVEVSLNGQALGAGKFLSNGYIVSGTNSCTTRIINGRLVTWGNPCPE